MDKQNYVVIHNEELKNPSSFDFWLDEKGFLKQYRDNKGWVVVAVLPKNNDFYRSCYPFLSGLN